MRNLYQDEPERAVRCGLIRDSPIPLMELPAWLRERLAAHERAFCGPRLWMLSGSRRMISKLRRNLTLNLGLRYDFSTPALEGKNQMANFDPTANGGAGGLVFGADGSLEQRGLVQVTSATLHLAWELRTRSIRRRFCAQGMAFTTCCSNGWERRSIGAERSFFVNNNQAVASNATAPLFFLKNGFPANSLDPNQPNLLSIVRVRAVDPKTPTPYVQQWSLGVQRELPWNLVGELNYVGTHSSHLSVLADFNQPFFNPNGSVQTTLPFPTFGYIGVSETSRLREYNGLEGSITRALRNGLSLRFTYTYSRSIDNTPQELESNSGSAPNGRDYANWTGPSDFDTPHRFITSYVYELPFGHGRRFGNNGVISYIIGGFKTSVCIPLRADVRLPLVRAERLRTVWTSSGQSRHAKPDRNFAYCGQCGLLVLCGKKQFVHSAGTKFDRCFSVQSAGTLEMWAGTHFAVRIPTSLILR